MNQKKVSLLGTLAISILSFLFYSGCATPHSEFTVPEGMLKEQFDFTKTQTNLIETSSSPTNTVYQLGVGDVLGISIYGEDGSLREVPVDPSGNISYLMIGTLPAAGRSINDLRNDLQNRISKKLARGLVQVVPLRFESQNYTILGELNYPGTYLMEGRTTILDAIAQARGIRTGYFRNSTAEMADYRNSILMRKGKIIPVDFDALIHKGDTSQNKELQNGDILNIPSSLVRNVYVLGEVHFPRTVGYVSSLSLIQALTEARGLTDRSDGRIVVVRGSLAKPEARMVIFEKMLSGKHPNIALAPGDIVYVPPEKLELLRDIVETAVTAFVDTISAGSATRVYQDTIRDSQDNN